MKYITTKILLAMVITALVILNSGCNGKFEESGSTTTMNTNETYTVYPNDELIPARSSEIRVIHNLSTDTKEVTLISGSATLLRGDYTLNR